MDRRTLLQGIASLLATAGVPVAPLYASGGYLKVLPRDHLDTYIAASFDNHTELMNLIAESMRVPHHMMLSKACRLRWLEQAGVVADKLDALDMTEPA